MRRGSLSPPAGWRYGGPHAYPRDEERKVRIVAEATAKPGKADALRAILLDMLPPSRAEAGCLHYELHEDLDAVGHFFFYERYTDAAAFAVPPDHAPLQAARPGHRRPDRGGRRKSRGCS